MKTLLSPRAIEISGRNAAQDPGLRLIRLKAKAAA
jgi:hypothetical protein